MQAEAHPGPVKKIVAAGHRLCDPSVSHDTGRDEKSGAYQSKEILDAERMITEASGGVRPTYHRAPGGYAIPLSPIHFPREAPQPEPERPAAGAEHETDP